MAIFGADIPFAEHCGIEEIGLVDGATRVRLVTQPHHGNNLGIVHGGVTCTLLDLAMGTVARTTVGCPVMTLDMQVTFLSPGSGTLVAEGRVVRAGRSIVFCESDVRLEADGTLVAKASGIFRPARGRSSASPS